MNTNITNPPAVIREVRSLAQIECEIADEVGRLKLSKLKLGRLLNEAREQILHGDFEDWVSDRGIHPRSARRYMDLAKSDNLTDLPDDADPTYRDAKAVHYSAKSVEWFTPPEVIERVQTLFDTIDLDPCSNSKIEPNVPAVEHFTLEDDGLSQQWQGRVYMNPPYGRDIAEWVGHLCEQYSLAMTEAVVLLPARTDTEWFRRLAVYPVCFVRGRLRFSGYENSAPFPSMVIYLGPDVDRFASVFGEMGDVYTPYQGDE